MFVCSTTYCSEMEAGGALVQGWTEAGNKSQEHRGIQIFWRKTPTTAHGENTELGVKSGLSCPYIH